MSNNTKIALLIIPFFLIITTGNTANKYLWWFDDFIAPIYDLVTQQQPITSFQQLEDNYHTFQTASLDDLLHSSHGEEFGLCDYKLKLLKGQNFVMVNGFDRYKYMVGNFRLLDFITKGKFEDVTFLGKVVDRSPSWNLDKLQYVSLDKQLLISILALQKELENACHNPHAFGITSAYRHPRHNKHVGGSSQSRHIHGDAVDIAIMDINQDGKTTKEDKKIVYNLLNKKIIKNKGGIGTYKRLPFIIHFDVRGHRARW